MNDVLVNENFETRSQKVLQVARQLYQSNPDWVTFFREVLGVEGAARSVFPDQNDYVDFEKTGQYSEIQQMVTNLRNRKIPGGSHNETTRVITVRLPESLHEALKAEAADHKTSMNKLCISKLLQVLNEAEGGAGKAAAARTETLPPRAIAPSPASTAGSMAPAMSNSRPETNPGTPGTARFGNY
jgi:predicted HicB family RNase H-like nuclease